MDCERLSMREEKDRTEKMGRSTGLEPATLGTTNRCSNQLSYDRHDAPFEGATAP